jgi:hypothetical protein
MAALKNHLPKSLHKNVKRLLPSVAYFIPYGPFRSTVRIKYLSSSLSPPLFLLPSLLTLNYLCHSSLSIKIYKLLCESQWVLYGYDVRKEKTSRHFQTIYMRFVKRPNALSRAKRLIGVLESSHLVSRAKYDISKSAERGS